MITRIILTIWQVILLSEHIRKDSIPSMHNQMPITLIKIFIVSPLGYNPHAPNIFFAKRM